MGSSDKTPRFKHGEAWPLRYVADPTVAKINPNYAAETGKTYPFVPMENVREQCEGISGFESRVLDAGGYTFFKTGDILFAKITPCTENGKIAQVPSLTAEVGFGSTEFIVISPSPAVDARFLYYQLTRGDIRALCASLMEGTTGRQRVPASIFRKRIQIPIPSDRAEQSAVAGYLDLTDSAIATVRESIAKADRLQKGLMQQLLTGRLKPDGTPRSKNEFWAHPKAGDVPAGWEVSPLKRLAEIQRGKFSHRPRNEPRFYGGPYPFIQTGDVSNSRGYILSHSQTLSEDGIRISRRFPKGTVFISIVGVNVAATAIGSYDVYATDSVIGMIPNDGVISEYLEFYLRSVQQKLAVLAGDSARENLNYGILRPLLVKYPSNPKEQRQIADILCNCESLIRAKEQKILALKRLKRSLMQNLLTGRVPLPAETIGNKEAKA